MKTLLIGEAPPRSRMRDTPTSLPFSGAAGRRLSDLIGQDITQAFETRNLIHTWPGASHHGSLFPLSRARSGAIELFRSMPHISETRMILAGGRVAKAMKMSHLPQLEWKLRRVKFKAAPEGTFWVWRDVWVARIPHPSGVNREWNDPKVAEAVRAFLLEELSHG